VQTITPLKPPQSMLMHAETVLPETNEKLTYTEYLPSLPSTNVYQYHYLPLTPLK
jgi:hypothetical protein